MVVLTHWDAVESEEKRQLSYWSRLLNIDEANIFPIANYKLRSGTSVPNHQFEDNTATDLQVSSKVTI